MGQLNISAIICTRNRADYLKQAISSLINQNFSAEDYEILVVDNASTDTTKQVVNQIPRDKRKIKYLYEPELGLSHARNTGWRNAQGKIIAYLDDDAIASANWLAQLATAFEDKFVGAAGGPIFPLYETKLPVWFHDSLLPLYSCKDHGKSMFDLDSGYFFYGVNMAIRKDIFEKVGGFRVDLGRKGNALLSDEELEIFKEIENSGFKKRYMPDATVHHIIPKERLTINWLLKRFFWMGKGHAIREKDTLQSMKKKIRAVYRKSKSIRRDLIRPRYAAGWYTRLIPIIYYSGYTKAMILEGAA